MTSRLRRPPEVFLYVCEMLFQGALDLCPDVDVWAADVVEGLGPHGKATLRLYLDEMLGGRYTNAELKGLLHRTDMAYGFNSAGARTFLETLRSALERTGTR